MEENQHVSSAAVRKQVQKGMITFQCEGDWTFNGVVGLNEQIESLDIPQGTQVVIEGEKIKRLGTAGAWLLQKLMYRCQQADTKVDLKAFTPPQIQMLKVTGCHVSELMQPLTKLERPNFLYQIGFFVVQRIVLVRDMLNFIGHFAKMLGQIGLGAKRLIFSSLVNAIDETGSQALPIIALMSFLIGVVLAYQLGLQLKIYGANIFIVNVTGMVMLREFAPLITAIIASGRTTSAFTAQIGMMKVKEEIDALRCLGLSPIERLVVPKVLGTVIALPLLTVWADVFGMFGSMVMARDTLDIPFTDFLHRFQQVIVLNDYKAGLIKAPVFALIIASVGCYQGFQVKLTAESVGWQTTKSVVQAIFLVIVADAGFSVLFNWANL